MAAASRHDIGDCPVCGDKIKAYSIVDANLYQFHPCECKSWSWTVANYKFIGGSARREGIVEDCSPAAKLIRHAANEEYMSLANLFKAAKLFEDMIERRDFVKRVYGDTYASKIEIPKAIIRSIKDRTGKPTLEVGLELAKKAMEDGHGEAINPIVAAVVDLCEGGE